MRESQFHTLVAKWLSEKGYYYEHEVRMPEFGRADFVAKHMQGDLLIVECKVGTNASDGRSIIQLVDYCRQLEGSKGGYAVPVTLVTDKIQKLCALYNVLLIEIDTSQKIDAEFLGTGYDVGEIDLKRGKRDAIAERIKTIARQQMAKDGTAALSLRAIAREMQVTAPALYRYFPSRDDLITDLIIDAFNDLADTLELIDKAQPPDANASRVMAFALAYRNWAIEHPTDYQLIYGNPIPGYVAPSELTTPTARRSYMIFADILNDALVAGKLQLQPENFAIPESIVDQFRTFRELGLPDFPPVILYLSIRGWAQLHGAILLELYGQLQYFISDSEAIYRAQVTNLLREVQLTDD
jgi:AcrR family transcriptional regulator